MPADLLAEDHHLHQAEAQAAVGGGAFHGQPPLVGHLGPELRVQVVVGVRHRPDPVHGAAVGQETAAASYLGHALLIIGELEVHGRAA